MEENRRCQNVNILYVFQYEVIMYALVSRLLDHVYAIAYFRGWGMQAFNGAWLDH